MTVFYNEITTFAVSWLRNLVNANVISRGVVDSRSIVDLLPNDVRTYTQAHFFAGIGVWSYALRCAGWPDSVPVWTGSCPCQPFSQAGQRKGVDDERHLWPEWFRLIRECRPTVILGEQVASPAGLKWFDAVCADLEGEGYAVGAADLCAAGVGAPHIRQRLYFVAHTDGARLQGRFVGRDGTDQRVTRSCGLVSLVGNSDLQSGCVHVSQRQSQSALFDAARSGPSSFWADSKWLPCRDGKYRPIEPGTFPLAHGVTQRVGRLRGYGNAIVAPLAAQFIAAVIDVLA